MIVLAASVDVDDVDDFVVDAHVAVDAEVFLMQEVVLLSFSQHY